jgi:hypothetical protein
MGGDLYADGDRRVRGAGVGAVHQALRHDACGGPAITLSPNTSGLIPAGFDNLAESFNLRGGNCIWFTDLSNGGGDATTEVCNNGGSTTKLSFEIPSGFDNKASRYYAS